MFGKPIGPLRIWKKGGDIPGLMMSRTFGDDLAHQSCGVIENPEINRSVIDSSVKCVVVGSDGLFEKTSNIQIAKVLGRYAVNSDSQGACNELVRLAKRS